AKVLGWPAPHLGRTPSEDVGSTPLQQVHYGAKRRVKANAMTLPSSHRGIRTDRPRARGRFSDHLYASSCVKAIDRSARGSQEKSALQGPPSCCLFGRARTSSLGLHVSIAIQVVQF